MLLVLHRARSFSCEYANWLDDYQGDIALVISADANEKKHLTANCIPNSHKYNQIIFLNEYDSDHALTSTIDDLKGSISHIAAPFEFDLNRAAELRKKYGLRGQDPNSAQVFRDKLLMKQIAKGVGLVSYRFAPVQNWAELAKFHANSTSGSIILKPRSGAASRGVLRVDDPHKQKPEIETIFANPLLVSPNFMVEDFVKGDVYHIDGLVLNGTIQLVWPSRYITGSLDYQRKNGQTISSAMLDPDEELTAQLNRYVSKLLDALPTPEICTFHCEVFVTGDGTIELCEIASRTGGVRIKHSIERAFGVDIAKTCLRAELGMSPLHTDLPQHPITLTGWATMAGRSGRVQSIPENCGVSGVYGYQKLVSIGDMVNPPQSAVDYIANCDIEGQSFREIEYSINAARNWFYSEFSVCS